MPKAFGYLRVSSQMQVEGDGFERQTDEIQRFADDAGFYVSKYFREEGISGTADLEDRPAFTEMIEWCLVHEVNYIIVEGIDRLAREFRVQEALIIYVMSKGLALLSARTGENITEAYASDPMRKALVQIQGIFAELEKSLLVNKLKKAKDRIRERDGRCEGPLPYGSTKEEYEIVKRIRQRYQDGANYSEIAEYLNGMGWKTRFGCEWTHRQISRIIRR